MSHASMTVVRVPTSMLRWPTVPDVLALAEAPALADIVEKAGIKFE